jgi:hypothetical protein
MWRDVSKFRHLRTEMTKLFERRPLLRFVIGFSILWMGSVSLSQNANQPPRNIRLVGAATYVTMPLYALEQPKLLWADNAFLLKQGIPNDQILKKFAYAAAVEGESKGGYLKTQKTGYVDGNGGIGLNDNFGSGRAAIIDRDWQIKGSGKTMMVNKDADDGHRNGASLLGEGVHEAIWGKLLAAELPYGAYRTVAIIATGTMANSEPRVLIVREDPLRPAHYVINPTAEKMADPRDHARINEAMKHLVDALPQPPGFKSDVKTEKFRSGIFELINRTATQHGYAWAHSLFHGGTSPSNAGMDGRMLDFGTFSAFDGYPNARVIDEDGFFGDLSLYKRDFLKDIRDSWVKTLPNDLLAVLPSEQEWFVQFEKTFRQTQAVEMLRLAGVFTEFSETLAKRGEGLRLAKILIKLAKAGNEKKVEIWDGENPFGNGTYNLGEILKAAASETGLVSTETNQQSKLAHLIPDANLRESFLRSYNEVFTLERDLAKAHGISPAGELKYRKLAVNVRNKKMKTVYHLDRNEKHIWKLLDDYMANGQAEPIQKYIDQTVSENRREFRDAAPFTIVVSEGVDGGQTVRRVFDAISNLKRTVTVGGSALKLPLSCEAVFAKAM